MPHVDSAIKNHIDNCSGVKHIFDLFNALESDVNLKDFKLNTVRDNTTIIDQSSNSNVPLFKRGLSYQREIT